MEPDPDEHQHPGEEDLDWSDETVKGNKPKGLYSKTSEGARSLISTEKQCALFCGGKKCKYCVSTGEAWTADEMVIKGLYSHWVTDNILAMARPSNESVKKFDIIQKFLDLGINTIINLQIAGEHADCGPHKLDPSGFLYNPQAFMEKGVFFYNFGWPDYGVASLSTILDMVKVMQFAVSQGKVAVHCHAGRGRTGVIIACYLVFTNRISGREAIHYIREKRPHSIQTRPQMQVIEEFEKYLKPFRTVFASRDKRGRNRENESHEFSLQQYLNRQRHILHGYEARRLKYVPKVMYVVCERLLELAKKGSSLQRQFTDIRPDLKKTFKTVSSTHTLTSDVHSTGSIPRIGSKESLTNMTTGKKKRYKASLGSTRNRYGSISMEDLANDKFKGVLDGKDRDNQSIGSSNSGKNGKTSLQSDEEDDNDSIVYGNSVVDIKAVASHNGESSKQSNSTENNEYSGRNGVNFNLDEASVRSEVGHWSIDESMTGQLSEECVQAVAYSLSTNDIADYVKERAAEYEVKLNETDTAWTALATEGDPHVLGQLLWDWLDQLKEPVLTTQDLLILLKWVDEPLTGLQKVEKGTRYTIEYLIKIVSKLKPLKDNTLVNIYEKLLSHLTHQWVYYDHIDCGESWAGSTRGSDTFGGDKEHWGEMKSNTAEKLFQLFHNIQHELDGSKTTKKLRY